MSNSAQKPATNLARATFIYNIIMILTTFIAGLTIGYNLPLAFQDNQLKLPKDIQTEKTLLEPSSPAEAPVEIPVEPGLPVEIQELSPDTTVESAPAI